MIGPPAKRARIDLSGGTSAAALAAEPAASSAVALPGAAGGDALSLVVALLAAAGSNAVPVPALTQALSLLQGASGSQNAAAAAVAAAQAQAAQAAQVAAALAAIQPLVALQAPPEDSGEVLPEDCVQIPNSCVGWLKGRQGGMIRDIELRSSAQCEIDQTTKDFGYSTAIVRGTPEQKKTARGLIIAEVAKVMDQSGESFDGFIGTKEEFQIDSQYVGWLKGPKGKVIQDLQLKSGTRIEVDQSAPQLGHATVKIFGTPEGVAQARGLVAHELSKIGPEAAAHIARAIPEAADPEASQQALTEYILGGGSLGGLTAAAAGQPEADEDSVLIPNAYVGWLKGRQGGMIRDIESRSGAQIDIDQSTKDLGYSIARIRAPPGGSEEQKKTARGLIIGEIAKVMEQSGEVLDPTFPGRKEELRIDGQYIGWLKGPKGKVVQDLQIRSATRIEVDQTNPQLGYATVKIFGTVEGILQARELISAELSKVSPEAAASIAGQLQGLEGLAPEQPPDHQTFAGSPNLAADPQALRASLMAMARSSQMHIPGLTDDASLLGALAGTPAGAALGIGLGAQEPQEVETVRVPNTCVGWLKGRNGAMIREIENRSQARIDIDQSTNDLGYSMANIRGDSNQRRVGSGLVIAEIAKVMDQSGEPLDESFGGCKIEFQIDSQYVGWLKGPRGKVVQDLQLRSGTRIDVDQSKPHLGYATVKVYGSIDGVQHAKSLIAAELSKAGPRKANMLEVGGDEFASSSLGELSGLQGILRQVSADPIASALSPLSNPLSNPMSNPLSSMAGLQSLLSQAALPNLSLLAAAAGAPPLLNPATLLQQHR